MKSQENWRSTSQPEGSQVQLSKAQITTEILLLIPFAVYRPPHSIPTWETQFAKEFYVPFLPEYGSSVPSFSS